MPACRQKRTPNTNTTLISLWPRRKREKNSIILAHFHSVVCCGGFCRFILKNNGVMFENDLLQIGVKMEFRQNLGRIGLFYGNKTQFTFNNFVPTVSLPGTLHQYILFKKLFKKLKKLRHFLNSLAFECPSNLKCIIRT